mmetsp:Transcript_19826/g.40261  ORF Transcript_19826/g.40261 Transcript_19826/m.40261 type:complete len:563 (+) Transcript_19826:32-1720(+)
MFDSRSPDLDDLPELLDASDASPDRTARYLPGDVVVGRVMLGHWYLAHVVESNADGSYVVEWEDGGNSDRVLWPERLRLVRRISRDYSCECRRECHDFRMPPGVFSSSSSAHLAKFLTTTSGTAAEESAGTATARERPDGSGQSGRGGAAAHAGQGIDSARGRSGRNAGTGAVERLVLDLPDAPPCSTNAGAEDAAEGLEVHDDGPHRASPGAKSLSACAGFAAASDGRHLLQASLSTASTCAPDSPRASDGASSAPFAEFSAADRAVELAGRACEGDGGLEAEAERAAALAEAWWRWSRPWSPLSCPSSGEVRRAVAASLMRRRPCAPVADVQADGLSQTAASSASLGRAVAAAAVALGRPLAFHVAFDREPLQVYRSPSVTAQLVGVLWPGEYFLGIPAGAWVRLAGRPPEEGPRWVLADGHDKVPHLEALWAKAIARPAGPGALRAEWPGVRAARCEYSLEWGLAAEGEDGGASGQHGALEGQSFETHGCFDAGGCSAKASGPCAAVLQGLPVGRALRLRVEARLPGPWPGAPEVRLRGAWSRAALTPSAPGESLSAGL